MAAPTYYAPVLMSNYSPTSRSLYYVRQRVVLVARAVMWDNTKDVCRGPVEYAAIQIPSVPIENEIELKNTPANLKGQNYSIRLLVVNIYLFCVDA